MPLLQTKTPRSGRTHVWAAIVLFGAVLGVSGCGWLYHYEEQMASEQEYLHQLDEMNRYLEKGSVEIPNRKEGDRELDFSNVSWRPPVGISTAPDKAAAPPPFVRYVRDAQKVTNKNADRAAFTEVYLALAPVEDRDFGINAVRAFPALSDATRLPYTDQPKGAPPLTDVYVYRSPDRSFTLFWCQRGYL